MQCGIYRLETLAYVGLNILWAADDDDGWGMIGRHPAQLQTAQSLGLQSIKLIQPQNALNNIL